LKVNLHGAALEKALLWKEKHWIQIQLQMKRVAGSLFMTLTS